MSELVKKVARALVDEAFPGAYRDDDPELPWRYYTKRTHRALSDGRDLWDSRSARGWGYPCYAKETHRDVEVGEARIQ